MSIEQIVAYQGELEFDGLFYDDADGWALRFRIIQSPETQQQANPFKTFTRRSGDRPGSRFAIAANPVRFGKVYNDQVMLKAWTDSARGWTVTFRTAQEPSEFHGCIRRNKDRPGTRFMAVFAEIDHDETVINQERAAYTERRLSAGKSKPLRLSNIAALMSKSEAFHAWLSETVSEADWTEESANEYLKAQLGITSKAELDDPRNTLAIKNFEERFRVPFSDWAGNDFGSRM